MIKFSKSIELSMFEGEVLEKVKLIPRGRVTTYKLLAIALQKPKSARVVGNALNRNPGVVKIPCHRVIKSDGSIGGYVAGVKRKMELLRQEGFIFSGWKVIDFEKKLYRF